MEFCSSKHPTYAKDMKVPGLLPDGGVPLPPSDDDMPPLDPKHKAVIIYLFHFAQEATSGNTNHDETEALVTLWQFAASVFMKKVYKLNIHPDSIVKYCSRVSANAGKAGLRWDHLAAAEIISSQVRDENTFNEVTSFLTKLVDVSHICSSNHLPCLGPLTAVSSLSTRLNSFSGSRYGKLLA